jgi:NAD(P)-dependent dehydrogenase (short-subunit alcohol dehydrogenase family)
MGRFSGKRFVITGAGGGLGLAYAKRLGGEGAAVVIAEIDEQLGAKAIAELKGAGIDATFVATDVASESSVEAMAKRVAAGGPVHGLVANAGWANNVGGKAYNEIPVEAWDRMMGINVRGTWLTVKHVAPHMAEGGSIVTVSSDSVLYGSPLLLHYVTSKAAIVGMTRCLARELGPRMIRVNAIAPGLTLVEATKDIPEMRWNYYSEQKFLKRKQMPDDVEGVVAFLLSDDSKYMTGLLLPIDGGFTLH